MKIVHVAPNATYNDYWGYQDNLLPKFQKKLDNDVTVITTTFEHINGQVSETDEKSYFLNDGTKIIRKKYKKLLINRTKKIFSYIPIYEELKEIKPDLIFFHGLMSFSIIDCIKYKKEFKDVVIVQDNHLDYNIGFKVNNLKDKLKRQMYRMLNKKSIKYIDKVYGVTPWRKKYAEDYFGVPESKTDVLIMGADDDEINLNEKMKIRDSIRKKYSIKETDFLIVTGGKIDKKKKITTLMKSIEKFDNVKLLIFGNVLPDVKEEFEELLKNKNINYIGWIDSSKVYDYFFAADLVLFPGQHSVLWEQACASKVPCVFEKWEGMDHVNNNGNSDFISDISEKNITDKIKELLFTKKYFNMKRVAESKNTDIYLYSNIAKKSLECLKK